jgi:serine/threonine-protein kinase
MRADQQRRVRELFEAAVDLDADGGLRTWVDQQAAGDSAVRDEVLSLLDHHARAGAFLSHAIVEAVPDLLTDEPLGPDTKIGPYTIVRELGRGGMGRVYLARDERLGRTVALKALAPHLVGDATHRERLKREARSAALLAHPGICTVYALEEIDGDLYIATEFVDGHTLRDEIQSSQRRPVSEVAATARELAAALASAHKNGIVHRDLKPENIMRTRERRLKILDFGLARFEPPPAGDGGARFSATVANATQPGTMIGTPAYMAPEQINGGTVDARSDIFAFGVVMYEFACGVHPFEGSTPLAVVARVLESDARPIAARCPDLPPGVAEILARCLRKAPADRYGSAAELAAALDAVSTAPAAGTPRTTWWAMHQLAVSVLYLGSAVLAWQIKQWMETPLTVSLFLALGAGCTIGCVLRGHLVFTEKVNREHLAFERRRTRRATLILDLMFASILFVDAIMISSRKAIPAVIALSLALSIALAALLLEPATTTAAFGDEP